MNKLIARTGLALSIVVAVAGVSAGMYVGMVTPPLSGGTLAGLGLVAAFGAIALRVIHVASRKRTAPPAPRPVGWVRVDTEAAFGMTTTELRDRFRTFYAEGAQ